MAKTVKLSSASNAGFHFVNLYQCCQRKFFIRWLVRPAAQFVSPALLYGVAFHEAKAVWYQTQSVAKTKAKAIAELKKVRTLFEYPEAYEMALYRCPILIGYWITKFGFSDFDNYDIIAVEGDFAQELPGLPGFMFTGRIDLVVRDKQTGLYYVIDTKTSSSSKDITEQGVFYGDQSTSYIWLAGKQLGIQIEGMVADIAYWNKNAKNESNIDCFRGAVVQRSERDIHAFLLGLQQSFSEISQKAAAYRAGHDEDALFPRNTYYCMSYGKPCEFVPICRLKLGEGRAIPGVTKDRRNLQLGGMIEDQIGES